MLSLLPVLLFLIVLAVETFSFISNQDGGVGPPFNSSYNSIIIALKIFVGSYIGAFIGDKLREFAFPDGIATTGFIGIIIMRVFWQIGPQFVGCMIAIVSLFWWGGVTAESTPALLKASLGIAAAVIAKMEYKLYKVRRKFFFRLVSFSTGFSVAQGELGDHRSCCCGSALT